MEGNAVAAPVSTTIVVLADDLIWASRLRAAIERAGATAVMIRSAGVLAPQLAQSGAHLAAIDLTSRGYDGVAAIGVATDAGASVICVAQHDDIDLRKRALAAGAQRVYSYNKLFSDGPKVIAAWLEAKP